jgi:hypothetical protein
MRADQRERCRRFEFRGGLTRRITLCSPQATRRGLVGQPAHDQRGYYESFLTDVTALRRLFRDAGVRQFADRRGRAQ